ncbi:MAG: LysM peptidoglycan-binding domain-containing protein [Rhizobiales bacterium]|nr:LysM peptidoglycan-binding domain-containing protein [Hyphomicrobiales bacterium]
MAFVTRDRWQGKPDAVQTAAATAQSGETTQPAQSATEQNESAVTTNSEQAATTAPAKEPEQQAAVEPKAEPEPAPEPAKPAETAMVKPSIDNVVVTEEGMAIVSGRAEAGTRLKIMLGEEVVGEAIANGVGDWYLSPEPILPPGEHNLVAVATPQGGEPVRSAPSSNIVVAQKADPEPQQTAAAEMTAKQPAVSEQQTAAQGDTSKTPKEPAVDQQVAAVDTASKEPEPVQGPEVKVEPEPVKTPEAKAEPEPAQTPEAMAEPEPAPAPERQVAAAPVPEPESRPKPIVQDDLGLDYNDAGDIMVSGKSEPGSKVRIVIDNKPVGDVQADASGQWLFKDDGMITPGLRDLRADKVLSDGKVVEGETFPVKRVDPVKIVKAEPEPVQENETVVVKTPEPAAPATEEEPEAEVAKAETQATGNETEQAAAPAKEPEQAEPAPETETAAVETQTETVTAEPTTATLRAQGRIVIQPGNNLWNISRVIYGRGVEYTTIYEANKDQIRNPHRIYPGQIFMTPGTVPPEEIDPQRREPLSAEEKQTQ